MKKTFIAVIAIFFLQIFVKVGLAEIPVRSVRASSMENENTRPQFVIDGKMDTRWASQWSDPQWLEIDLGTVREVVGLTLYWETAYGKLYEVLVSNNGRNWKKVYQVTDGDGVIDDIYFKKTPARYIKILGKERGTGWGYSLWEISVKGVDEELIFNASSFVEKNLPDKVMDGRLDTYWHSGPQDSAWIEIEMKKEKEWGGILLNWGDDYAVSYEVRISKDRERWTTVYKEENGDGGMDKILVNLTGVKFLRIIGKKSHNKKGYAINEIALKKWEEISRLSSLDRVRGLVAWEGSYWKTFVGRDGSFAPEPYPHQVSFWLWDRDEKKLFTPQTLTTKWELLEGALPVNLITWKADDINVETTIFAREIKQDNMLVTFARTSVKNNSKQEKNISLYVVIQRNPIPQRKGEKELREIRYDGGNWVRINNKQGLYLFSSASQPDKEDIRDWAGIKILGKNGRRTDPNGWAKGRLVYHITLKPGEKRNYDFVVPSPEQNRSFSPSAIRNLSFDSSFKIVKDYWKKRVPMELTLPDKRYTDAFYSSIYYILMLMDGELLYPGASAYFSFFLHDAVEMSEALDKVGLHNVAKSTLRHFNYQEGGNYLDELGGNIYAFYAHYLITKDEQFLRRYYPKMLQKCRLLKKLRARQLRTELKGTPFYGLLPQSVSQDNFTIPAYLYVDNWWGLNGLKSAIEAAKILKKTGDLTWLTREYNELHKAVLESLQKVKRREGIDYFPAFADNWAPSERKVDHEHRILGETQMAWAHRPALYPGQALGIKIPLEEFKKSYQHYWNVAGKFSGYDGGWFVEYEGLFWGYNVKLALPLSYLGMEEVALKNIRWSIENQSIPGAWMEAIPSRVTKRGLRKIDTDGGIVGDVPHGWVASLYVLLLRNMLLLEQTDKLILLSSIPQSWLKDGKYIDIKNAPTYFGEVSYRLESHLKEGYIKLALDVKKGPPEGYTLNLPVKKSIKSVQIDGKDWSKFKEKQVFIPRGAKNILIYY